MTMLLGLCRAAAVAACCALASAAWAAAPDNLSAEPVMPDQATVAPTLDYALETEMVVHNWVLCVSASVAEELAHAREVGVADARTAYTNLANAKSCGQFPELHVILRERLYSSANDAGYDARVFGALVNLSGDWATAFVVSGTLADN